MELYKKLQINKKTTNNKYPSKIRINSNNIINNQKIMANDAFEISTYSNLLNTQIDDEKTNRLQKSSIQPVNFYISSINKVYNNTDRSININHPNTNTYKLQNKKKSFYCCQNKLDPINTNINNTFQIVESNPTFINNNNINMQKFKNSLKKHFLNLKSFFDNDNNSNKRERASCSQNKSNYSLPLTKIYLNKNSINAFRSQSGDNKNTIDKNFLDLIKKIKVNNIERKKNMNNKNKIIITDSNIRYITNSNKSKKRNSQVKMNIKRRINKLNDEIELENINENQIELGNNNILPKTNRQNNKIMKTVKNTKKNKGFKRNITINKIFDDKKLGISFISSLKNEMNNETIDKNMKLKKHIFNFIKNKKINKSKNANKMNIKTLINEPCKTYRKNNKNQLMISNKNNNICDSDNNINTCSLNYCKINDIKTQILPLIYKKRKAISPLTSDKIIPSILPKKEDKNNKKIEIQKIILNNNNNILTQPIIKSRKLLNILNTSNKKLNLNYIINKNKTELINNNKINSQEIMQSKSMHQIFLEPNIYKNSLSEKTLQVKKENKNSINAFINNQKTFSVKNFLKKREINMIKIKKNSSICKGGENYSSEEKKINQDNLFKTKFDDLNISYYGVCDGHGKNGHLISEFIKKNLPLIMYKEIKSLFYIIKNNKNQMNQEQIKAYFSEICKQSFNIANKKLISNKNIDTSLSGSTCMSVLFYQNLIISVNLGDSRGIIGKLNDNKWSYELLSRDHKPSEIDEALRIKYKNGDIHPYFDENGNFSGPNRVWLKSQGIPGLAMTRSFGDIIGSSIGVISEPEIKFFNYGKNDKFIIIGSDGLWEYISSQEAVDIVGKFYHENDLDTDSAVVQLFQLAKSRWIEKQMYVDDISIIIIFFM